MPARAVTGVLATRRSRKGRTVKDIHLALWERELAEHLSWHPDLENLPPPVFPRRRSRLGRWIWRLRQARRLRRFGQFRNGYVLVLILLIFQTLLLVGIAGWLLGWYVL
jgi:hypothetical protein